MNGFPNRWCTLWIALVSVAWLPSHLSSQDILPVAEAERCRALLSLRALTITSVEPATTASKIAHCYVRGTIAPNIRFHVQLPSASRWNGRFLMIGDGGLDGVLNVADNQVDQGYAVANSNSGHDAQAEPFASFGFHNMQSEIDFGYRAVHLTANAAKAIVDAYYGRSAVKSYFDGCSTGGRQALMEAQRYPDDFDGIVAGAPANYFQRLSAYRIWVMQRLFRNAFAANLAFDTNGDGQPEGLEKVDILRRAVIDKCDANDGMRDGLIGDPLTCDFKPREDLAEFACPRDVNGPRCFTTAQIAVIEDIYRGAYDSRGRLVHKGLARGSEAGWGTNLVPHAGNNMRPSYLNAAGDHFNYLFYDVDPGLPPTDLSKINQKLRKVGSSPEFGWWEFSVDDVTSGKGQRMATITDSTDADLSRFVRRAGKLILFHGWADSSIPAEPTLDYYKEMVALTFGNDIGRAREAIRLFLLPGGGHCGGNPGPGNWDHLAPIVEWVEHNTPPDHIVVARRPQGVVEEERRVCAYPLRTVYVGPVGGQADRKNLVQQNFACLPPP